ncbi:Neutral/alkaline non-lysosomal ceramidase [Caulifigura coniformis]|uniref:Neutral/alkaline non-lysosomal ceramidase n=2 Tax=Caulifigura coniformis TaxID=2527983 RepID=A0A517S999_9PLAN|nr:Neutral/alkaline non-lysosomal ceramidase [Caulifigura coniformis]
MLLATALLWVFSCTADSLHAELLAGTAKVDITNRTGPVNDPLFVKALVLRSGETTAVIMTLDAVAVGEIGHINNDYLPALRARVQKEFGIAPTQILVNASHCHGIVAPDVGECSFQAVSQALKNLVPVRVGVGVGHEDRVSENRRIKLKSGKTVDVRHAYSFAADADIASVGPIDPAIGVLRLDRVDGRPLAVVYNFACHPIQGVPSGANTADMTGFASQVIEDNLGHGAVALFVQGCGGDINPVSYKAVDQPRDAEPLGNMLGLSTLKAVHRIQTQVDERLVVRNETLALPRSDQADRIAQLEQEQTRLAASFKGTTLNFKTFLQLMVKHGLTGEFPSSPASRYLHEKALGREQLSRLDAENRKNVEAYLQNILAMEELTRVQTNLALLRKHQAQNIAAGKRTVDVELASLRIGEFMLLTFPGELTVQIGLNLKSKSPHPSTFIAGYTNGYIYYAPTKEQLENPGNAQEDCDSILAPEWQEMFEKKAIDMLNAL